MVEGGRLHGSSKRSTTTTLPTRTRAACEHQISEGSLTYTQCEPASVAVKLPLAEDQFAGVLLYARVGAGSPAVTIRTVYGLSLIDSDASTLLK